MAITSIVHTLLAKGKYEKLKLTTAKKGMPIMVSLWLPPARAKHSVSTMQPAIIGNKAA